jgi:hypothetical protein
MVQDREALMGCITSSHELHVARILKAESDAKAALDASCSGVLAAAREEEMQRNRDTLEEVRALTDSFMGRAVTLHTSQAASARQRLDTDTDD